MESTNDIAPDPAPAQRSRVAQLAFATFAVLAILFVIAQLILNSPSNRLGRAGRNLDALAARAPDAATAAREFPALDLQVFTFVDYGPLEVSYELRLRESRLDAIWKRVQDATQWGKLPELMPRVGEIRFRRGLFVSSSNSVTKTRLGASESETSATK